MLSLKRKRPNQISNYWNHGFHPIFGVSCRLLPHQERTVWNWFNPLPWLFWKQHAVFTSPRLQSQRRSVTGDLYTTWSKWNLRLQRGLVNNYEWERGGNPISMRQLIGLQPSKEEIMRHNLTHLWYQGWLWVFVRLTGHDLIAMKDKTKHATPLCPQYPSTYAPRRRLEKMMQRPKCPHHCGWL